MKILYLNIFILLNLLKTEFTISVISEEIHASLHITTIHEFVESLTFERMIMRSLRFIKSNGTVKLSLDPQIVGHNVWSDEMASVQQVFPISHLKIIAPFHSTVLEYCPADEISFFKIMDEISNFHSGKSGSPGYYFLVWPSYVINTWSSVCESIKSRYIDQGMAKTRTSRLRISINSNFFIILFETNDGGINSEPIMLEVYSIKDEVKCKRIILPKLQELPNKLVRRQNFGGIKIVGASDMTPIWSEFEVDWVKINGTICCARGSAISIFEDLATSLNFSGEYMTGDGKWIQKHANGTFFGSTINVIQNGTADLSLTQTRMTADHLKAGFRFLQQTYQDGVRAYFRQPPANLVRDIHTQPFELNVWAAIFLTWTLLGISVSTISIIKFWENPATSAAVGFDYNAKEDGFIWAIGLVCSQGWHNSPNSFILRLVFISGGFTLLLVSFVYSATIISTLTSEIQILPIRSFEDILSSQLDIFGERSSGRVMQILKRLKERNYENTGRVIKDTDTEAGPNIIMKQQSAFLQVDRYFYLTTNHNSNLSTQDLCRISSVPAQRTLTPNAMIISNRSHFREFFNYKIIQLKERGLNFRYSKEFVRATTVTCLKHRSIYREDLGLNDVFTVHGVLYVGLVISVLVICIEKMYHHFVKIRLLVIPIP